MSSKLTNMENLSTVCRFIGDVHGKYGPYKKIIKDCPWSIQVGDMGVGFLKEDRVDERKYFANPPFDKMKGKHFFIRGNHDNPDVCKKHQMCIPDGLVFQNMMFIGGAISIDRASRTIGYDWWPDEELLYTELQELVDKFIKTKPEIMITHTCPHDLGIELIRRLGFSGKEKDRTSLAFQEMWSAHSPKLWVFGHYHLSFDQTINNTRFICLNELEYKDIDVRKEL